MKKASINISTLLFSIKAILVACIYLTLPLAMHAQRANEYQVKAAFLYNFTKFVEWPTSAFDDNTAPFVIGIFGNNPFGGYLAEIISGETAFGRPMIIRHIDKPADASGCHILFVNTRDGGTGVLSSVKDKPVLTVSDDPEFCRINGCIRFFSENETIRLEINSAAAKNANLVISSKLLRIAKIYP